MWWLILVFLWAVIIGAVAVVVHWPHVRTWLGAKPREDRDEDWVALAAAMNRHPAGKGRRW